MFCATSLVQKFASKAMRANCTTSISSLTKNRPLILNPTKWPRVFIYFKDSSTSTIYTHPMKSSMSKDIRFILSFGTYLTFISNLIDPSFIIRETDPIPTILLVWLFSIYISSIRWFSIGGKPTLGWSHVKSASWSVYYPILNLSHYDGFWSNKCI